MMTSQTQLWKGSPFSIERKPGKAAGTVIFCLQGPFTARDMYGSLTPDDLQNMLNFQSAPDEQPPAVNILDLTSVPYMDSAGLGMVVGHYVRCHRKGVRFVAAGATPRVRELFRMTKVDTTLPLADKVEDADTL
ncbi:MAG: STAS domain-containing protein [Acidobacteria bacterium]|jgi:anti-anti-sigma factor|nr:STAS domain-containing protein [Acidobacteriota bacterium]